MYTHPSSCCRCRCHARPHFLSCERGAFSLPLLPPLWHKLWCGVGGWVGGWVFPSSFSYSFSRVGGWVG